MNRYVILIAATVILGASAYLQGVFTHRWRISADLAQASERLKRVPTEFGEWKSEETTANPRALFITQATGYLSRRYTNTRSGRSIEVLILCGSPGPFAVHPPEACYGGIGYKMARGWPQVFQVAAEGGVLNESRFVREGPAPEPIQVLQAWTLGNKLEYPDDPRWVYAVRLSV